MFAVYKIEEKKRDGNRCPKFQAEKIQKKDEKIRFVLFNFFSN